MTQHTALTATKIFPITLPLKGSHLIPGECHYFAVFRDVRCVCNLLSACRKKLVGVTTAEGDECWQPEYFFEWGGQAQMMAANNGIQRELVAGNRAGPFMSQRVHLGGMEGPVAHTTHTSHMAGEKQLKQTVVESTQLRPVDGGHKAAQLPTIGPDSQRMVQQTREQGNRRQQASEQLGMQSQRGLSTDGAPSGNCVRVLAWNADDSNWPDSECVEHATTSSVGASAGATASAGARTSASAGATASASAGARTYSVLVTQLPSMPSTTPLSQLQPLSLEINCIPFFED